MIRWYYLWGHKEIPYTAIRSARQVRLSALRGKGRIWGTANPRYWASLDPGRPGKQIGIVLDVGTPVKPFITPSDPLAVEAIIKKRAGLTDIPSGGTGPII